MRQPRCDEMIFGNILGATVTDVKVHVNNCHLCQGKTQLDSDQGYHYEIYFDSDDRQPGVEPPVEDNDVYDG